MQQPAILPTSSSQPPSYSTSSAAAYDAGTEDIRRRQEELERKAAELERRERAMQQTAQGQREYDPAPVSPSMPGSQGRRQRGYILSQNHDNCCHEVVYSLKFNL